MRREGIHCTHYIDDSLYIHNSESHLRKDTTRAKNLLESLGFTINREKSSIKPS